MALGLNKDNSSSACSFLHNFTSNAFTPTQFKAEVPISTTVSTTFNLEQLDVALTRARMAAEEESAIQTK